jgi:hypothetical protein
MRLPRRTTRASPSNSRCRIYDPVIHHCGWGPLGCEVEIAQQPLDRAQNEAARQTWQTQVDVHQMLVDMAGGDLEEPRAELSLSEAMVTEMETNQGISLMDEFFNPDDSTDF